MHVDDARTEKEYSFQSFYMQDEAQCLPAAPSFSASFSNNLKFSALFNPRPPVTTIRAFPRSGRSDS